MISTEFDSFWSDVCKQISADYLVTMYHLFYISNDVSLILH
jgi:hypothetical protein